MTPVATSKPLLGKSAPGILSAATADARASQRQRQQDRAAFERVRRAEANYRAQLRKVAKHVSDIVRGFDAHDVEHIQHVQEMLKKYSRLLEPWAKAVAWRMINEVARRDERAWAEYTRLLGLDIQREIQEADTGRMMRERLAEQVELIKSLPLEAAQRVHDLTVGALPTGERAADIAAEIRRTGNVTMARANLIARTEIGRTATEFTRARAEEIGSTHYIWRTVRDGSVRPTHMKMEGKVCAWAEPPEVEPGKFYHAGCFPNCRCISEPVIP